MKKRNLFVAAYLMMGVAVGFTSCSNDDDALNGGIETPVEEGVQRIVLQVSNGGDGLTTRAGRPLLSSEADQEIDKVELIIYNSDSKDIVYHQSLDWNNATTYTTGGHGKQMVLELKGDDKLSTGTYNVYAIGYTSSGSSYNYGVEDGATSTNTTPFADILEDGELKTDQAFTKYITATLTDDAIKTYPAAEEIFAGTKSWTVPAPTTNTVEETVTLHRQVTGTFGYFQNIPYTDVNGKGTGTKLRLVASAANKTILFDPTGFNSNFTETGTNVEYVVNAEDEITTKNAKFYGTPTDNADDAIVIYEAKFADWFNLNGSEDGDPQSMKDLDADGNGYVSLEEGKDAWQKPSQYTGKASFIKGSMFASSFLVPVLKKDGVQTLQLQLVDDSGTILRYWNINLAADEDQVKETIGTTKEDVNSYSLVRNHLYTVGKKDANNPTDQDPDPDPDPDPTDPDYPEDLGKGQFLTVKVNDNWEAVHNMVID